MGWPCPIWDNLTFPFDGQTEVIIFAEAHSKVSFEKEDERCYALIKVCVCSPDDFTSNFGKKGVDVVVWTPNKNPASAAGSSPESYKGQNFRTNSDSEKMILIVVK